MNEKAHKYFYESITDMMRSAPPEVGTVTPHEVIHNLVSIAGYMARVFMVDFVAVAVSSIRAIEPDEARVLGVVRAAYAKPSTEKPS
jgi:hypothetical protein